MYAGRGVANLGELTFPPDVSNIKGGGGGGINAGGGVGWYTSFL